MGLYSVALPFGLRACVYYTVAGIFENRTGFLSLARHCLRQCREPAAASFQPERKERKKGNETMRAAAGGEYTHTHILRRGNESTTWALNGHHLNFVLLFGRSVGKKTK
jgi:hypothetical protein